VEVGIIILSLVLAAFFSGMEIAFISSNKIYLEIEKNQDGFMSGILKKLTDKPSKFIAAMLVGNNLALVVYGFFASRMILHYLIPYDLTTISNLLLQAAIATAVVVFTSEFLPKVFFHIYANSLIRFFALPAYVFYRIFYYVSAFVLWVSDIVLKRFFGTDRDPVQVFFSKVELGNFISEQMSSVNENEEVDSEIQIFQNALDFSDVKARDIMTPRMEIAAIEIFAPVAELRDLFVDTGYSKILVYQDSLDDILGYVHSFDLFREPRSIKSIMIPVEFVPQTIYIKDAMDQLTKKRKSVAVVLDEYGGTAGIVTMEDIVEELFGEIEDEHDDEEMLVEEKVDENTWLFSTRHDVEYLNEQFGLEIPEGDSYSTLGGFIVNSLNEIPQKGSQFSIGKFRFVIEDATLKKIELVRMIVG